MDASWVGPVMQGVVTMIGAEKAGQLSAQQLAVLAKQYADMQGIPLPDLKSIEAELLGPSEVGAMRSDQSLRSRQMQKLAELQNIIDSGGLDLSDRAGIEEALGQAANQQKRARAGVASDAAARGQLNSGARLVMDMDAATKGANAARSNALNTAAMAQRRRLDAIRESANTASGLREQDWREGEAAARARDLRAERNANAREKAKLYNAGLAQQNFNNAMSQKAGQAPSANGLAAGFGNAADNTRADAAGLVGVIGAGANAASAYGGNQGGGAYQYEADLNGNRGGAADISRGDDEK